MSDILNNKSSETRQKLNEIETQYQANLFMLQCSFMECMILIFRFFDLNKKSTLLQIVDLRKIFQKSIFMVSYSSFYPTNIKN